MRFFKQLTTQKIKPVWQVLIQAATVYFFLFVAMHIIYYFTHEVEEAKIIGTTPIIMETFQTEKM